MPQPAGDPVEAAHLEALCAKLRNEDEPITPAMAEIARRHRIHLVLAATLRKQDISSQTCATLRAELRAAAMVEMLRERALRRLIDRLASASIDALVMKGAGLAYTLYPSACLRPREDVDIIIRRADLDVAARALTADGWVRSTEPDAELASTQRHYQLAGPGTFLERLDLHWKIAIPQVFADAVTVEELISRSVPVDALGTSARTLSPADALFVACIHRVAHHQDAVELLWLWDIHLLASRLRAAERERFVELARRASMRAVCARGLTLASERFKTANAIELISALQLHPGERPEPSAGFLGGDLRQVDLLRSDLSTLRGWRARAALVGEHLFPSVAYMRSLYPKYPTAALPLAYAHRIGRGAPKWFRQPRHAGSAKQE